MYTSLTGLNASQTSIDIAGNNIANSNTTAYKSENVVFETQLSQTLSTGSSGDGVTGGTNPIQLGRGVNVAAVTTNFTTGSINSTGIPSDVAINGDGLFVLENGSNETVYSRDGEFKLDSSQTLVNSSGYTVMGYGVDSNYNLITSKLSELDIPVGNLTIAEASTTATFTDNLDSSESTSVVASTPGSCTSEALVDQSTGLAATENTLLTSLATADDVTTTLFAAGNTLTVDAEKGDRSLLSTSTFTVTATTTVGDYMNWLESNMALDTSISQTPAAGVSISNGQITVTGNLGNDNVPTVSVSSNGSVADPMTWTTTTPANAGTSSYTSFTSYDSLGNSISVGITATLVSRDSNGSTWQYITETLGDSGTSQVLGSGTISYDSDGNYLSSTGNSVSIDRSSAGADDMTIALDFSGTTSMASKSTLTGSSDGCAVGTLTKYNVSENGTIVGTFSNGVEKTLGQIVLASFNNNDGLISVGNNCYTSGPNSGDPAISTAGTNGTGTLTGGALELSNVDITQEFIDMISASTMFSASGKVISTSQDLLQSLMTMMR
jgi:flagellar hook protein FlgE